MQPIAEYEGVDRERFEREIVSRGEPAVMRGLVVDWSIVQAAKRARPCRSRLPAAFCP